MELPIAERGAHMLACFGYLRVGGSSHVYNVCSITDGGFVHDLMTVQARPARHFERDASPPCVHLQHATGFHLLERRGQKYLESTTELKLLCVDPVTRGGLRAQSFCTAANNDA
jgi:hypothetical protein